MDTWWFASHSLDFDYRKDQTPPMRKIRGRSRQHLPYLILWQKCWGGIHHVRQWEEMVKNKGKVRRDVRRLSTLVESSSEMRVYLPTRNDWRLVTGDWSYREARNKLAAYPS
jgi:hypothetical protein